MFLYCARGLLLSSLIILQISCGQKGALYLPQASLAAINSADSN